MIRKMLKKIKEMTFLTGILVSMICFTLPAFAADGVSTLTIHDFSGSFDVSPGTGYTSSDLFSSFKNMVPGDVMTEEINVKNMCLGHSKIRVLLATHDHDDTDNPLSPGLGAETSATSDEFLSNLSLKIWSGDTLIYDDAANVSVSTPIPLATIGYGQSAVVKAEVSVPITLGNEVADRAGEIDWILVTEDVSKIGGGSSEGSTGGSGSGGKNPSNELTVRKLWSDGNDAHKEDSVTIYLNRDGKPWESVVLNHYNQWTHVFSGLNPGAQWSVEEISDHENYVDEYVQDGNILTIRNIRIEEAVSTHADDFDDLTVKKEWASPEHSHPDYVECTLYQDDLPVETVRLSEQNGWTYTWKELDGASTWQVLETYCEGDYVPRYDVSEEGTVVITNSDPVSRTGRLIQTGQLSWPVYVFGGLGLILLIAGIILRKKNEKK